METTTTVVEYEGENARTENEANVNTTEPEANQQTENPLKHFTNLEGEELKQFLVNLSEMICKTRNKVSPLESLNMLRAKMKRSLSLMMAMYHTSWELDAGQMQKEVAHYLMLHNIEGRKQRKFIIESTARRSRLISSLTKNYKDIEHNIEFCTWMERAINNVLLKSDNSN